MYILTRSFAQTTPRPNFQGTIRPNKKHYFTGIEHYPNKTYISNKYNPPSPHYMQKQKHQRLPAKNTTATNPANPNSHAPTSPDTAPDFPDGATGLLVDDGPPGVSDPMTVLFPYVAPPVAVGVYDGIEVLVPFVG